MCDPVSVSTALTIGTTVASTAAQYQRAQAQKAALKSSLEIQSRQINAAAQQKALERSRVARAERARLLTAAGEAGVTGASVDAQLRDSRFQQGYDRTTIETNRRNRLAAAGVRAADRNSTIARPNLIGAGLQIADEGYNLYNNRRKP